MGKATKIEALRRVDEVYSRLVRGDSVGSICRNMSESSGISVRQAERYIAAARERMQQLLSNDQEQRFAEHVAALRQLRADAWRAKQYGVVLRVLEAEGRLLSLLGSHDVIVNVVYSDSDMEGL
jgi:hypothetical protein